ncbi:MAG: Ig-like domain-containing protein [Prolixibacteraceae bacterium]|jgi:hypothetical protein
MKTQFIEFSVILFLFSFPLGTNTLAGNNAAKMLKSSQVNSSVGINLPFYDIFSYTEEAPADQVFNSTFDTDINGWYIWAPDCGTTSEWQSGEAHLVFSNSGSGCNTQFMSTVNLQTEKGKIYRVTFDARALNPVQLNCAVRESGDNYYPLGAEFKFPITGATQTYSFDIIAWKNCDIAQVLFSANVGDNEIWIDNVYFTEAATTDQYTSVTLQVDMQNEIVATEGVFVVGGWNSWASWSEAEPMVGSGNIWTAAIKMVKGTTIEYIFKNGATGELITGDCKAPDSNNRILAVPQSDITLGKVCFNSCGECVSEPNKVSVTFRVDMQNEIVSPDGVFLNGDWNNWETPTQLTNEGSIYSATLSLTPGETYQYKFLNGLLANPDNYEIIPAGDCINMSSGNRELTAGDTNRIMDLVCFGSCSVCEPPQPKVSVTFRVDMQNETVSENGVYVNGSWSDWAEATALTAEGTVYSGTLELTVGETIIYKFVNGTGTEWDKYESPAGDCSVGDNNDRQLIVPESALTLDLVCFNTCSACVNDEPQVFNSTFDTDINGWYIWAPDCGTTSEWQNGEAHLVFPNAGSDCNTQFMSSVNLQTEEGKIYRVTFDARSLNNVTLICKVRESGDNYNPLGAEFKIPIFSTKQTYSFDIIASKDCTIAQVLFEAISSENEIWIDNVYFTEEATTDQYSSVTLQVDMQNETIDPEGVFVGGTWISKSFWTESKPMIPIGSIYSATIKMVKGTVVYYRFMNGEINEEITGDCNLSTSANRYLIIPQNDLTLDPICFGRCEVCESPISKVNVTFQVDMQNETVSPDGVFLNGDWNNWESPIKLTSSGSIYSTTVSLVPGETYQYKFLNGTLADFNNYENIQSGDCINPDSGNREILVPSEDKTIDLVCFGNCSNCEIMPEPINVTFQIDMQNEIISENGVYVNGTWGDSWYEPKKMIDQGNSVYAVVVQLYPEQEYLYAFGNGGPFEWSKYENFSGPCTDENSNRSITTTSSDTVVSLTCFNSCEACAILDAPLHTIREIQGEGDISPYEGQLIKTKGRITGINEFGCFIQDATDIRSGIFVYEPILIQGFSQGNDIQLIATVSEYNGRTQLSGVEWIDYSDIGFTVEVPFIEVSEINEDYEGVFIGVRKLTVLSVDEFEEYAAVSDLGEAIIIDNYLIQPELEVGATYMIFGVIDYQHNSYRLNPRATAGIRKLSKVTFQVDMQNETVSENGVFVNGSWGDWQQPIQLSANGSVYSTSLYLVSGASITYKFVNGEGLEWDKYEIPVGDCTVGDYKDREFLVPETDITLNLVCFNSCEACVPMQNNVNVTFRVDMQNETVSPDGVFLNGDLNNWESPIQLTNEGSVYSITVALTPGATYQYKFINGSEANSIYEDILSGTCINSESGNREITIPTTDVTLDLSCFGNCNGCVPKVSLTFHVDMQNETVSDKGVFIKGSWDNWEHPVALTPDGSVYSGTIDVDKNSIVEYIFINGEGESAIQEKIYGCTLNNSGFRYFDMATVSRELLTVCFNSCSICYDHKGVMKFQVDMQNELVSESGVYINGSWNDWKEPIKMVNEIAAIYTATIMLNPGQSYVYNFANGGSIDGFNYEKPTGSCTNGTTNRTVVGFSDGLVLSTVCYGTCFACNEKFPPVALNSNVQVDEDHSIDFLLNGYDEEDELSLLTFSLFDEPIHAKVFSLDGRTVTYEAEENYSGNDTFHFVITDSEGNSSGIGTINIAINAVNDRPEALPFEIDADSKTQFDFDMADYIHDVETEKSLLTVKFVPETGVGSGESVLGGTVTPLGGTLFRFETTNPVSSEDFIVYRVSDGNLNSYSQVISISNLLGTKSQLLTPLVANILTATDTTEILFNQAVDLEFLGIDMVLPFEQLQMTILKQPEKGILSNFKLNQYNGNILTSYTGTYTCNVNADALDSIVYEVSNGIEIITGTQYLKTYAVKTTPKLQPIAAQKMNEDETLQLGIGVTDMDTNLADLEWKLTSYPQIGMDYQIIMENGIPQLKLQTPINYYGNSVLKLLASDSDQLSDSVSFSLTVLNVNDAPEVQFDGVLEAIEDMPFDYVLKANDMDKDSLFFSFSALPDWVIVQRLSKYTYELSGLPENKDVGETSISVSVSDLKAQTERLVSLRVVNTDDPPYLRQTIDTIYVKTNQSEVTISLPDYFADDDPGAELSYRVAANTNPDIVLANISENEAILVFVPLGAGISSLSVEATSESKSVVLNFMVKVEFPTGTHDISQIEIFNVYPNPVKEILHVKFNSGNQNWKLEVFNLKGQLLYNKIINQPEYSIQAHKIFKIPGNYAVKATSKNNSQVRIITVFY